MVKSLLLKPRDKHQCHGDAEGAWRSTSACAVSASASPEENDQVGQVTGLAWTEVGGELLTIEAAVVVPGKGKHNHTGQLGDVMKESIEAAMTVVRSRAEGPRGR